MAKLPTVRVLKAAPVAAPLLPVEPEFCAYDHPRLAALRRRWRVVEIAGEGSDFERARRLRIWTRERWQHGYDQLSDPRDAVAILEAVAAGKVFNCFYSATVFSQACLAVGLPARVVAILHRCCDYPVGRRQNFGHTTVEVYCRELGKWVVMDPDRNAHYERAGELLSATDLHHACWDNQLDKIEQVMDDPQFALPHAVPGLSERDMARFREQFERHRSLDYYAYVKVATRQGFSSAELAAEPPAPLLVYAERQPPAVAHAFGPAQQSEPVTEAAHFNWPLAMSWLQASLATKRPGRTVQLDVRHNLYAFSHVELRLDGGPWRRLRGTSKRLTLPFGVSEVEARAVDLTGMAGHSARLSLEVSFLEV